MNKSTASAKSSAAKSPATTITRTYAIQLGYFSEETNASKLVQKAKEKGLTEMRTQTETRNGVTYFRVLIGRCPTLSEAQKLLDQVHRVGLKGAVYRL
jgi:cell division septation protein DedD